MPLLPCGYLILDKDSQILESNEEATRLLGWSRNELRGRRLSALLPIAGRIFLQSRIFSELAISGALDETYLSFLTASGGQLPVVLNARVRAPDGSASFADCIFVSVKRRDLYERELIAARDGADRAAVSEQRALSRLAELQTHMFAQERLATLGTLAAGVAHEVKNPLTYVQGNVELLQEELNQLPPAVGAALGPYVRDIHEGLERIRGIAAGLRSLSRVDTQRQEPVNLEWVAESALRIAAHELRGRAHAELITCHPPPVVAGDEGRMVQVVINLLINAAQAMPERDKRRHRIVVRLLRRGPSAVLEVEDDGTGIPPEILPRIFDPFFTTKKIGIGTGLGLAICLSIVESMGGAIDVESTPSVGTTVRVTLPCFTEGSGTNGPTLKEAEHEDAQE